jgi:serine/threonine-protein kinase RsbW
MSVTEISIEVTRNELPRLRGELGAWLAQAGATGRVREEILLACWEATANAIEHPVKPKGRVLVVAQRREEQIVVAVTDRGSWRPSDDRHGHDRGLGLKLIAALMDRVQVVTTAHGTRVMMCRCLTLRRI